LRAKVVRTLILLTAAAPAGAAWKDVAPRPFENGAYVELFGSYESDGSRNSGRPYSWSDTFLREKLGFFSNGYFYHPRFIQYRFAVSGALKQENYAPNYTASIGWTHATGLEYEGRLAFLPEHPYTFEMFALRHEPLYKQQSATQHNTIETSNGANFRYRRKPYFLNAGYLDNTTSSRSSSSNVKRLNLNGEYFKRFVSGNEFSVSALFTPTRFTGDLGLEGSSTEYGVTGLLNVQRARLNVTATKDLEDQTSPVSGRVENDRLSFQERLSIYFPLNFRSDLYYRILNNTSTSPNPNASGSRELTDDSTDLEAILYHRLYQSLDSRYTFLRTERDSSGGRSTAMTHSLGFDYSKLIPRGRVMVGVNAATSRADTSGRTDIVDEPHPAIDVPATKPFPLGQPNVDRGSIAVFLRSPLPPFQRITLVEGPDYVVSAAGSTFQIQVLQVPSQFTVPGTYDFTVSYSLTTGTFELRTDTYGFNTSVQLLDNLLTPYYSWTAVRSDLLAGVYPGTPLDSTTNTLGLIVLCGPWRAVGEFQDLDWAVSPYRSFRAEAQYVQPIDPTLRVYATSTLLYKSYSQGTSYNPTTGTTEKSATISGNVQKEFLSRTLTLSAGGSLSRVLGQVESNAYALDASLIWRIGKLELIASADAYGSSNQAIGAGDYTRNHQYYYVKMRRRFF
jgi:hypothetical protein